MKKIKTPEEIIRSLLFPQGIIDEHWNNYKVNNNWLLDFSVAIEAMEAYKNQLPSPQEVTDEEIWDMVQGKYFRSTNPNKGELIQAEVNAMIKLRSKLTNNQNLTP